MKWDHGHSLHSILRSRIEVNFDLDQKKNYYNRNILTVIDNATQIYQQHANAFKSIQSACKSTIKIKVIAHHS